MKEKHSPPNAFVIMPFADEFTEVYRDFITPSLEAAGYRVLRADDLFGQRNILRDVVESIVKSDLVIADLTELNPNVFYELGVAHALGRPVILLTQNIEELPFDLRSYRVIPYETHFSRIEKARALLQRTAAGARTGALEFGNPLTDFALSPTLPPSEGLPSNGTQSEAGWLDHLVALEEGYGRLTEIMESISGSTTAIGNDATSSTERMQRAKATAGAGRNSAMKLIAAEHARRLSQYGDELVAANNAYEEVALSTEDSVEYVIGHAQVNGDEDRQSLQAYVENIKSVHATATAARESMAGMRESVRGLEGLQGELTRAARVVGSQLDRLIGNIDRTRAANERGISVGERRLQEMEGART